MRPPGPAEATARTRSRARSTPDTARHRPSSRRRVHDDDDAGHEQRARRRRAPPPHRGGRGEDEQDRADVGLAVARGRGGQQQHQADGGDGRRRGRRRRRANRWPRARRPVAGGSDDAHGPMMHRARAGRPPQGDGSSPAGDRQRVSPRHARGCRPATAVGAHSRSMTITPPLPRSLSSIRRTSHGRRAARPSARCRRPDRRRGRGLLLAVTACSSAQRHRAAHDRGAAHDPAPPATTAAPATSVEAPTTTTRCHPRRRRRPRPAEPCSPASSRPTTTQATSSGAHRPARSATAPSPRSPTEQHRRSGERTGRSRGAVEHREHHQVVRRCRRAPARRRGPHRPRCCDRAVPAHACRARTASPPASSSSTPVA